MRKIILCQRGKQCCNKPRKYNNKRGKKQNNALDITFAIKLHITFNIKIHYNYKQILCFLKRVMIIISLISSFV